jgi:hypothetical protein
MTTGAKRWDRMIDENDSETRFEEMDSRKEHRLRVLTETLRSFYTEEEIDTFNPDFRRIAFFVRDLFETLPILFQVVDEETTGSDQVRIILHLVLNGVEGLASSLPKTASYVEELHLPTERS